MYRRPFGPFTAAGILSALLFAAWIYSPENTASSLETTWRCEAQFDPAIIPAGSVHHEVAVSLSDGIGEVYEVDTPNGSGLMVLWMHDGGDGPGTARVRVSALDASPGEWQVTVQGAQGSCSGSLTVESAD